MTNRPNGNRPEVGELVPQPHGGALQHGSKPGQNGPGVAGPGRPPSAIREVCGQSFERSIPILEAIRDSADARDSDRLKAIDLLGKYGGIEQLEIKVDRPAPPPALPAETWERLKRLKSIEQLERMLAASATGAVQDDTEPRSEN